MKLLKKYRFYTYTSLICVVIIGFSLNYYLFRYSIHRTTDDVLNEYRLDIEEFGKEKGSLEDFNVLQNKLITIHGNMKSLKGIDENIFDTLVYSRYEGEMVVYRKLRFPLKTTEQNYMVELMLPTLEEDDLVGTVIISLTLFVVLFILFMSIIDRMFTANILYPFKKILEVMRSYNIEERTNIKLENGGIDEFRDLNEILMGMTTKINNGYDEMKEFLEHTSHEMKTPLAIIQLKLEVLNQSYYNNEEDIKTIASIQTALNRIIRFNKSLLFIAKIKNNQFNEGKLMDLNGLVHQFLTLYEELLDEQNIQVELKEESKFTIEMHPILAEQLIQNILSNAVKHNNKEGFIKIFINDSIIRISNSFEGKLPAGDLFEKYKRSSQAKDSSGLGLGIVKSICIKEKLTVEYTTVKNQFTLTLSK